MKYIVFLGDGMADTPIPEIEGKTPLMVAKKPNIDSLASKSELGLAKTVPDGMKPGSDTANLSVMGYDPRVSYSGRSPLEALSMGLTLNDTDVAVRCNLVTLSSEEEHYADKRMIDYSSGEISTEEAKELIEFVQANLGTERLSFHAGISYRHCLIVHNATVGSDLTPPHDITGKPIKRHLPTGVLGDLFTDLMVKSYDLLKDHPINLKRIAEGKNPANSIWLWGEGTKPSLPDFEAKTGVKGAVISAVDLLKGIGKGAGMEVIEVKGATGNVNTDFAAKGKAAIDALSRVDYVYIHVEAPDESGHQGNLKDKIYSIEKIDSDIVGPVMAYLKDCGEAYHVLVCPDHPTPIATRTHSADPIPYLIYKSDCEVKSGVDTYDEETAKSTGIFVEEGYTLIDRLFSSQSEVPQEQGIDPDVVTTADGAEEIALTEAPEENPADEEVPAEEAEEPQPKKKRKFDFKAFFKRHLIVFIIIFAVLLVAGGLCAGHFIATYHLAFVHSEEGLTKALAKDKVTTLVFKKDVVLTSDLILDRPVNIDLNKHTLTVEGNVTIPVEKPVSIGYKTKGNYVFGGKIVAESLTLSGTSDLRLMANVEVKDATVNAAKIEYVGGTFTAENGISMQSESIFFNGTADATLSLSANADFTLRGTAAATQGGKTVTLQRGTIGSVVGLDGNSPIVYDHVGGVEKTLNVANYYRVTRLATPAEIYVLEENGDFRCYVSEVIGATEIRYSLNGVEQDPVAVTPGTTVINLNSDNLTPGEQTIRIRLTAPNDPRYVTSEEKTCKFKFSAQLDTPIPTVAEEEGKIVLTVPAIKHADKYVYTICGNSYETKTVKTDISDKVTEGGVYIIKVTAVSDNKYFSKSNEAMTSYVTHLTLAAPVVTAVKTEETVAFTWEAVEHASNYYVTYGADVIYLTGTSIELPYVEDASFRIQSKAKGGEFYLDSTVTVLTAAEIVAPAA